jgi:hypothetical protein
MITSLWVNSPKATVRSTASRVRLRASPTPVMCLASKNAISIAHQDA